MEICFFAVFVLIEIRFRSGILTTEITHEMKNGTELRNIDFFPPLLLLLPLLLLQLSVHMCMYRVKDSWYFAKKINTNPK